MKSDIISLWTMELVLMKTIKPIMADSSY